MTRTFVKASRADWDRFYANVVKAEGDACWLYYNPRATKERVGYPQFRFGEDVESAHLFVLEQALGRLLLPGKKADHRCHIPADCNMKNACLHRRCVRLDHLAEVTAKENAAPDRKVASIPEQQSSATVKDPVYTPSPGQVIAQVKMKKAKLMAEDIVAKEDSLVGSKARAERQEKFEAHVKAHPEEVELGRYHRPSTPAKLLQYVEPEWDLEEDEGRTVPVEGAELGMRLWELKERVKMRLWELKERVELRILP